MSPREWLRVLWQRVRRPAPAAGVAPPAAKITPQGGDRSAPASGESESALLDALSRAAETGRLEELPPGLGALACLDRLLGGERAEPALTAARRLIVKRPDDAPLRLGVAERLQARLDFTAARVLLEPMVSDPQLGTRARFVLGEGYERLGDRDQARRLYEQVLAHDFDYPNARARAKRMRDPERGAEAAQAQLQPTLLAAATQQTQAFRYRLLQELGRGAFGAVYLAHDEPLGRDVAIKILHPQFYGVASAERRARFFEEARLAARIRHPGIVAVYDVDESLKLIAMEHCAGGTLRSRLARGPLPPPLALARAAELLAVLGRVHRHGVVHGDVKPGNLLFRRGSDDSEAAGNRLVLADFGTAHWAGERAPGMGTLLYMAPEQRRGGPATEQSDLFSVGMILAEMLTGAQPPHLEGQAPLVLLQAVLSTLSAPLRPPVAALLEMLLAPDPAARPADAALAEQAAREAQHSAVAIFPIARAPVKW